MTLATVVSAAIHSSHVASITITADSDADVSVRYEQLRAIPGAGVTLPPKARTADGHRWCDAVIYFGDVTVIVSTRHEPIGKGS